MVLPSRRRRVRACVSGVLVAAAGGRGYAPDRWIGDVRIADPSSSGLTLAC